MVFRLDHAHTWTSLHAQNITYVRRQDYAHMEYSPETLATQKTEQNFQTKILTT